MAGLLSVETSFAKRTHDLGYRERPAARRRRPRRAPARVLRGHEFHYATIADAGDDDALRAGRRRLWRPPAPPASRRGRVTGWFFHVIAAALA